MRDSLSRFVKGAWHILESDTPLQWNWHLDAICDHVQALVEDAPGTPGSPGTPQDLLINVPPGTMKSMVVSVMLPAWRWLTVPSWRAIYASGSPSIVTRDSMKCRSIVQSDWYNQTFKPKWKISSDQNEKQHFANTAGGFRKGLAAGASVTGERADFLGIDDPNDAKEVHSKAHRTTINENWWSNAFHNRIADPAKSKRCIVMQRLHEEDLAGYVLSREKGWAHLCLPMECEGPTEPTWLGWRDPRKTGELLFPMRFGPDYLVSERASLGSSGYAGQMQQRPVAAGGNKFQRTWWRFWATDGAVRTRPAGTTQVAPVLFSAAVNNQKGSYLWDELIGSFDCTFKDTDGTDYVVGVVVARRGAQRFVMAMYRKRASFTETVRMVRQMHTDWPMINEILIEDKANGPAVINALEREVAGLIPVNPEGGKEARAATMEPKVEAGNWLLPEGAEWLGELVDEFASFPLGKHDDIVDACSQVEVRFSQDTDESRARLLLGL